MGNNHIINVYLYEEVTIEGSDSPDFYNLRKGVGKVKFRISLALMSQCMYISL